MPTYNTPGVYVEEVSVFPPSVAAVATAIPVFIGVTKKAVDTDGSDLTDVPKRITSLLEYEQHFDKTDAEAYVVDITQTWDSDAGAIDDSKTVIAVSGLTTLVPTNPLYYCMQIYFANGGGPCYVLSIGPEGTGNPFDDGDATVIQGKYTSAFSILAAYDEPTLVVSPDAVRLAGYGDFADGALTLCSTMKDRFTILDVPGADVGGDADSLMSAFRTLVSSNLDEKKYAAGYFPYLKTTLSLATDDATITIGTHTITPTTAGDTNAPTGITGNPAISDTTVIDQNNGLYNEIKAYLGSTLVATLPPAAAIAGVYAKTDSQRGVWKAPANVSLAKTSDIAITITDDLNDRLNVDSTAGKSINAIRTFTGQGQVVWGARTLAGNDLENRYVPVRSFLNFVEESTKKATGAFVFEPNDANTWIKARSMTENFLTLQWRDGALQGAKPGDAFQVSIGLNETMTAQDILDGKMIIEISLAIVRPAEFIVLRFMQMVAQSG